MARADRASLVPLADRVRSRREALPLLWPETPLRRHRVPRALAPGVALGAGPSAAPGGDDRPDPADGGREPLWGAERIRGELQEPGLRVANQAIQAYLRVPRVSHPRGQAWAIFPRDHAPDIRACDVLPVTDLRFRSLFAFFVAELASVFDTLSWSRSIFWNGPPSG